MARPNLIWPLTLLAAFAVLVAMLLLSAFPVPTAAQDRCAPYPVGDPRRAPCYSTATSKAGTELALIYPNGTPTPKSAATSPPPPAAAVETSTNTPIASLSPTVTVTGAASATPLATLTPTATRQIQGSAAPTPTSTLVGLETIICAPGDSVTISGQAEPGRALLIYFDDRPVGGSLVRPDGHYTLLLHVGYERPGLYLVVVRERDGLLPVRALACTVPGGTPTPTEELIP